MSELNSNNICTQKDRVANILKRSGNDSLSYFHLQDDRHYFFSPSGETFLSYKIYNKVAVVGGDPVGLKKETDILLTSFISYLKVWGLSPCLLGLSKEYKENVAQLGLRIVKIGEEAILDLKSFDRSKLKKKVRRAVRYSEKNGLTILFSSPENLLHKQKKEIRDIYHEWLKTKGKKGKRGFSMTLNRLPSEFDADCQVVLAVKENKVLGFLTLAPIYQQGGLSLDLVRHGKEAPNGINEFLIVKTAEYFKEKSINKISLNFAAFSNMFESNKKISNKVLSFLGAILSEFYESNGLRKFNEKFLPQWESRYVAFSNSLLLPVYVLAIARAEG